MDATTLLPDGPLPDDVKALRDMARQVLAEVARLRQENAERRVRLDAALKHRFGRRGERHEPEARPEKDESQKGKATPHGRAELPAHLERREVVHDLAEAEQLCPCRGKPRTCVGEQTAERLDLGPARFFVRKAVEKTYACQECDPAVVPVEQRIHTAGPEQVGPIAKGLRGPGLPAHVITAEYADHTPWHRLAGQLARSGVRTARSTPGDWLAQAALLLPPLVALLRERVLQSRLIHPDDTHVKLRVKGAAKAGKAHLWAYVGDADHPHVVFDFTADHTASGPVALLEGYRGYLQADALARYEGLYGEGTVKHCCCRARARRKFVAAVEGGDQRGQDVLERIGELYAIGRSLPALLPPSDEPMRGEQRRQREELRHEQRKQAAEPTLAKSKGWSDEHRAKTLPKSALGQAIGYALNNWEALCRYLGQGYPAIANNLSERALRAIALGRDNWGVIGSAAGGETAAVPYTVAGTCKHLGIDPFVYLREALMGLFALGERPTAGQVSERRPDRWLLRRARESPARAEAG
jgi:transposase